MAHYTQIKRIINIIKCAVEDHDAIKRVIMQVLGTLPLSSNSGNYDHVKLK